MSSGSKLSPAISLIVTSWFSSDSVGHRELKSPTEQLFKNIETVKRVKILKKVNQ
jgi:hypothetical protein